MLYLRYYRLRIYYDLALRAVFYSVPNNGLQCDTAQPLRAKHHNNLLVNPNSSVSDCFFISCKNITLEAFQVLR